MSKDLPEELVDEILSHIPSTNLKRLRSTCKGWNRLYKDLSFVTNHTVKSPKQFRTLMLTNRTVNLLTQSVGLKAKLSLPDPEDPCTQFGIFRVFHCDGLLLCTSQDQRTLIVWNPLTCETRRIITAPDPDTYRIFVLGYSSKNKSLFKILSFCIISKYSEMYSFDSDSWSSRIVGHDIAPGWDLGHSEQYVSLNGSTYMFAREERKDKLSLVKFDFSTEIWGDVTLPCHRDDYTPASVSVVREEKLSVLLQHKGRSKLEIWVSSKVDQGIIKWSKFLALDLSCDLWIDNFATFLIDEEKKLVVFCTRWLDMEHETNAEDRISIVGEDGEITQVGFGVLDMNQGSPAILNYVPSLVQIDRARGKKGTWFG